jgi:hypothetical protein
VSWGEGGVDWENGAGREGVGWGWEVAASRRIFRNGAICSNKYHIISLGSRIQVAHGCRKKMHKTSGSAGRRSTKTPPYRRIKTVHIYCTGHCRTAGIQMHCML